jgi:hypothetical protein
MENKELETWLAETKAKNLSRKELFDYANNNDTLSIPLFYKLRDSLNANDLIQTVDKLFNQWQKEAEFSPKRGDRVLVWNDDDQLKGYERIFLAEIKGEKQPIIAVMLGHEELFLNGEKFNSCKYKNMKPLPTDFKSKVIELIEKRIDICNESIEEYKNENKFYAAEVWKNCKIENQELLKQIKDLC